MQKEDFEEVAKHISIFNVAYHLSLEIVEIKDSEAKAICPFCGYNKNSKIATLSLNAKNNKYFCSRCGVRGFSIGLYSKLKNIDTKIAYKELLSRKCFSIERSHIEISPINEIADIDLRNKVYKKFLDMLKLESRHRKYLQNFGFLYSSIDNQIYRTIPKKYIQRRLISHSLSKQFDLAGIPGFYQEEDGGWIFTNVKGFFIPIFDENNRIKALSMHLDQTYKGCSDIWFSSKDRINGTGLKACIAKSNISVETDTVIITDNLLLGNLIKDILKFPIIAFSSIVNSYQILNVIDKTNIKNIIFVLKPAENQNLYYIIHRIFKDLIPLGYNLEVKNIMNYKDVLKDDFLDLYRIKKFV